VRTAQRDFTQSTPAAQKQPGCWLSALPGAWLHRRELSALLRAKDSAVKDCDVAADAPSPPVLQPWTVRRVLEWTTGHLEKHGSETPRLDAEVLLAHARQCKRIQLYTSYDEELPEPIRAQMRALVQRRAQREPVAYLVGHREFFSLDLKVTPDVLIPRPDTETLVLEAIAAAKTRTEPQVLDLCTGSGCVAIAVAKNCPTAQVTATDLSSAALEIARENVVTHKLSERVALLEGDLFAAVPTSQRFDIIASNPPYVPTAEIAKLEADVRAFEPKAALDGGVDGLDVIRRLLHEAPEWLLPGGVLLLEFSPEQATPVQQLARDTGRYGDVASVKDLGGRARVLRAKSSAPA
jgi:release factor glutamine methyltransferase